MDKQRLQRKRRGWLVMVIFIFVSICQYYHRNSEERLKRQVRKYEAIIDSKISLHKSQGKHQIASVNYRVKEFPRLQFKVEEAAYDLLNKEVVHEVSFGDTISMWIKNDLEAVRVERQVYGLHTDQKEYLSFQEVLKNERKAGRRVDLFLLIIMILLLAYYFRLIFKKY